MHPHRLSSSPIINWRQRVAFFVLAVASPISCMGGDWPQVLGPHRNGQAGAEDLADNWTKQQPQRAWQVEVGEGYAGPAVQGDRLVVFHRLGDVERLDCLSVASGDLIWKTEWKATYGGGHDRDSGPRCVPEIHDGKVVLLGAGGDLHCVQLADGAKLWSRRLGRDYGAQDGYFGFGSAPLICDDVVLVNIGGRNKQAGIVGLDFASGKTRWNSVRDSASYSAPIQWPRSGGKVDAIFVTRLKLVGIAPSDGKTIFQLPFGATGPTVNAATPLLLSDDRVFVTASYRIGAKCVSLEDASQPQVVWSSDNVLSSQYPTPVLHAGHLYGVHGREDGPPASLRCVDTANFKVKWQKDRMGMAHGIVADGKLVLMTTSGELVLVALNATKYEELGRIRISTGTTRAMPALSNGRLFVRNANGELSAWQLP